MQIANAIPTQPHAPKFQAHTHGSASYAPRPAASDPSSPSSPWAPTTGDARLYRALLQIQGDPFWPGNRVKRLRNGNEIFPAMFDAIDQAEDTIEMLNFAFWTGGVCEQFIDKLTAAVDRGVNVRLIVDAWGSKSMPQKHQRRLEAGGVQLVWFRPLKRLRLTRNLNRTHRRSLIIDGKIGFTGGVGIGDEWQGDANGPNDWRDTHFRIEGPAIIGLRAGFEQHWCECGHRLDDGFEQRPIPEAVGNTPLQVAISDAALSWSRVKTIQQTVCRHAQKRLWLTTAYFTPSEHLRQLLMEAVERGVDVRVLMPGPGCDTYISLVASEYKLDTLIENGVKAYRYRDAMMHAKTMVIDDDTVLFGSANFNHRSRRQDDEILVTAVDRDLNQTLANDFEQDIQESDEVGLKDLQNAPWYQRALRHLSVPLRPQL